MNNTGKIYIAGPMTGIYNNNYEAFHAKECELLRNGSTPVNPAREFGEHLNIPWHICLASCVGRIVRECDKMYMLPGWSKSRGAVIEWLVAKGLDLLVVYDEESEIPPTWLSRHVNMAHNIVYGDRENDYGPPYVDFIRQLGMAHLSGIRMRDIEEVPLFMMMVKISRQVNKPKNDNLIDICGYAMTIRRCRDKFGHSFKRSLLDNIKDLIWLYFHKRTHIRLVK